MGRSTLEFGFGTARGGKFDLGATVGTPAAIAAMRDAGVSARDLLARHIRGDWGDCCAEDAALNEAGLLSGGRLMSVYRFAGGAEDVVLWVITEWDRSVTTILTPDDY